MQKIQPETKRVFCENIFRKNWIFRCSTMWNVQLFSNIVQRYQSVAYFVASGLARTSTLYSPHRRIHTLIIFFLRSSDLSFYFWLCLRQILLTVPITVIFIFDRPLLTHLMVVPDTSRKKHAMVRCRKRQFLCCCCFSPLSQNIRILLDRFILTAFSLSWRAVAIAHGQYQNYSHASEMWLLFYMSLPHTGTIAHSPPVFVFASDDCREMGASMHSCSPRIAVIIKSTEIHILITVYLATALYVFQRTISSVRALALLIFFRLLKSHDPNEILKICWRKIDTNRQTITKE